MSAWQHDAACRDEDPDLFSPHDKDTRAIAQAKAVCAVCPVRAECLAAALAGGDRGIWGGTTEEERREMKTRRVLARAS